MQFNKCQNNDLLAISQMLVQTSVHRQNKRHKNNRNEKKTKTAKRIENLTLLLINKHYPQRVRQLQSLFYVAVGCSARNVETDGPAQ